MSELNNLKNKFTENLSFLNSTDQIQQSKIDYLGKSGYISILYKQLALLNEKEKKDFGQEVNNLKNYVEFELNARLAKLSKEELDDKLLSEKIDLTLPIRDENIGSIHPISQVIRELTKFFANRNFKIVEGCEIEDDYHNFSALNVLEHHPAREMQDTFYLPKTDKVNLLRTQTSSVQIRYMENNKPPLKIISIGKTYRSESDMTHTPMFHQIEGLVVDTNINIRHLKSTIEAFIENFFNIENLPMRFRSSFFPFTEPSMEVDIGCIRNKDDFQIGHGSSWMEILGCGMVHPKVLSNVGIDPSKYQGFAFGGGVERLAMLKYGIRDLREFFEGDIRWHNHFGFSTNKIEGNR